MQKHRKQYVELLEKAQILQFAVSLASMFPPTGGPEPEGFVKLFAKMIDTAVNKPVSYICYRGFFTGQQQQGQPVAQAVQKTSNIIGLRHTL